MEKYCTCRWDRYKSLIREDPTYGWVLSWIELTEEKGYTQIHKFGLPIKFCPICGCVFYKNPS